MPNVAPSAAWTKKDHATRHGIAEPMWFWRAKTMSRTPR